MFTPLLPEVLPEINANPVIFYGAERGRRRAGHVWSIWLTRLQNTENEANLLLPRGTQKLKVFQL